MIRHFSRRLAIALLTIVCIYVITFLMVVILPGNPFQHGQRNLAPETEMAMRARYNMDNNWLYFLQFVRGVAAGDFGPTFMYNDWTCNQIIAASLPVSILLGLLAILIAILFGIPVGVISARHRSRWPDHLATVFVMGSISIPTFVVGTILLLVFGTYWQLAPIGGWGTLAHLPLPALTLALPFTAYLARLTRTSMLDSLSSEFVRTAAAKGLSRRSVIWRHAFRVAALPVLSYLGPATAQAMTGSFVVEKVFGVPGIGQHFVNAALNRDAGLIMSTVLVFSTFLVIFNLLVDVAYAWADPRVGAAV